MSFLGCQDPSSFPNAPQSAAIETATPISIVNRTSVCPETVIYDPEQAPRNQSGFVALWGGTEAIKLPGPVVYSGDSVEPSGMLDTDGGYIKSASVGEPLGFPSHRGYKIVVNGRLSYEVAIQGSMGQVTLNRVELLKKGDRIDSEFVLSACRKRNDQVMQITIGTFIDDALVRRGPPFSLQVKTENKIILLAGICSSTEKIRQDYWTVGFRTWLKSELGYHDDEIINFSYSPDGWQASYSEGHTLSHIPDVAKNLKSIYDAYPNATFDIIGHSLGGVVALYFATTTHEVYTDRTNSIVTVDSPVRGRNIQQVPDAGWVSLGSCATIEQASTLASQLSPTGLVATTISHVLLPDWKGPAVATVTNELDPIVPPASALLVGSFVYCRAEPGRLSEFWKAHSYILDTLPSWFKVLIRDAHSGKLVSRRC